MLSNYMHNDLSILKPGMLIWLLRGTNIYPFSKWGYRGSEDDPRTHPRRLSIIPANIEGDTWYADGNTYLTHYKIEENALAMVVLSEEYPPGDDWKVELLLNDRVYLVWGANLNFVPDHTIEALEKKLVETIPGR